MARNKSFFIKRICVLSDFEPDSEEAQNLRKYTINQLIHILNELEEESERPKIRGFSEFMGCTAHN